MYANTHSVAIIGANGQVATEIAILLSRYDCFNLVCFVRSKYSAFLLQKIGLDCRIATFDESSSCSLEEFDLVLNFAYPAGDTPTFFREIESNIRSIMSRMKPYANYVHMSSIMALGMPSEQRTIREFRIPRSTYAYIKRFSERIVEREGKRLKMNYYCFRLGQVHGILQSVTNIARQNLSRKHCAIEFGPKDLSIATFPTAVVKSLLEIMGGDIPSGTYAITNRPQLDFENLFGLLTTHYRLQGKVFFHAQFIGQRQTGILKFIIGWMIKRKDFLNAIVLNKSVFLFRIIKRQYRSFLGAKSIPKFSPRCTDEVYRGKVHGRELPNAEVSRYEIEKDLSFVEGTLEAHGISIKCLHERVTSAE